MKTKTIRARNVCLLTGRHEINEQSVQFTPELITAPKFGMILFWDGQRFPYLKLKLTIRGQEIPSGSEAYTNLADQLGLEGKFRTPPPKVAWCCLLQQDAEITVSGHIDTNDPQLYEITRNLTDEFTNADAVLTIPIKGLLLISGENEQFELEVAFTPSGPSLHPKTKTKPVSGYLAPVFDGYIGLDIGNHNSTVAAYRLSAQPADPAEILNEAASGAGRAFLDPEAEPILSGLCYRSVARVPVDDAWGAIKYEIGRLADQWTRHSMDGVELAAKRLAASPLYQRPKDYRLLQLRGDGKSERAEIPLPRALAAELLASRMLHLFREASRSQPVRLAVSYPTTFSEREIHQFREVVHRGWLRMYPRPQTQETLKPLKREFSGPAKLASDREGILFMLDEASAAAFFFLFDQILKKDGQLSRFRYLYPHGMNLLLFDCGGGTTDIALVRALVRPHQPRKLVLTVRGRIGHRHFGGDFITEAVFRLLKAKAAAELARENAEDTRPRVPKFPQSTDKKVIEQYLKQYEKEIDRIIPTQFTAMGLEEVLSEADADNQERALKLWAIAESVKRDLALAKEEKEPVKVVPTVWAELNIPDLTEDLREALGRFSITRQEVDALVGKELDEVIENCNALIKKKLVEKMHTGIDEEFDDPEDVHWVVAAGAACKYPLIPKSLREKLNVPFLNSTDEEFHESRMRLDEANLKHAVAKGLAKVLMIKDGHDIELEFDSDLSRRLPFEVLYHDAEGHSQILFRENAHFDSLTDPKPLRPKAETPRSNPSGEAEEEAGHNVILYRRFPGETKDTPYLTFHFREGVEGKLTVRYDADLGAQLDGTHPFVMVNETTREEGECRDLLPKESYLHPVQRGDL